MSDSQRNIDFGNQNFTVQEAAAHLRVSRALIYKMHKAGSIKLIKLGARSIVTGREIQRVLKAAQSAAS